MDKQNIVDAVNAHINEREHYMALTLRPKKYILDTYVQVLADAASSDSYEYKREVFLAPISTHGILPENPGEHGPHIQGLEEACSEIDEAIKNANDVDVRMETAVKDLSDEYRTLEIQLATCVTGLRAAQSRLRNDMSQEIKRDDEEFWKSMRSSIIGKYGWCQVLKESRTVEMFVCNLPESFYTSTRFRRIISEYFGESKSKTLHVIKRHIDKIHDVVTKQDYNWIDSYRHTFLSGELPRLYVQTVAKLEPLVFMPNTINLELHHRRCEYVVYEGRSLNIMGTIYRPEIFTVNGSIQRFLVDDTSARVYNLCYGKPIVLGGIPFTVEIPHGVNDDKSSSLYMKVSSLGFGIGELRTRFKAAHTIDNETYMMAMKTKIDFINIYDSSRLIAIDLVGFDAGTSIFPNSIGSDVTSIASVLENSHYAICNLEELYRIHHDGAGTRFTKRSLERPIEFTIWYGLGDYGIRDFIRAEPILDHLTRLYDILRSLEEWRQRMGFHRWIPGYFDMSQNYHEWGITGGIGDDVLALMDKEFGNDAVIQKLPFDVKKRIIEIVLDKYAGNARWSNLSLETGVISVKS